MQSLRPRYRSREHSRPLLCGLGLGLETQGLGLKRQGLGFGLDRQGLGLGLGTYVLGLGLVTAVLDYISGYCVSVTDW